VQLARYRFRKLARIAGSRIVHDEDF
jgi:hypothetical protein